MKYGALKSAIIAANAEHPEWTATQIAEHVGCTAKDVHKAKSRYLLEMPLENLTLVQLDICRRRNAEAVRKVFKAEASATADPRIMTAFATLAAVGDVEMLDRVMRSLRV